MCLEEDAWGEGEEGGGRNPEPRTGGWKTASAIDCPRRRRASEARGRVLAVGARWARRGRGIARFGGGSRPGARPISTR